MALIKTVRGKTPIWGSDCYFAENATLVGDVEMGSQCSLWFQSVVRGDVHWIRLGDRVNVQDGAVIHATYERAPTLIGSDVSIGHRALVHGCTLEDKVLIGMGAIVMDGAVVRSHCLVAAGAVVLEGMELDSYAIYAGVPAKKVKDLSPEKFADTIERIAKAYVGYSAWFKDADTLFS